MGDQTYEVASSGKVLRLKAVPPARGASGFLQIEMFNIAENLSGISPDFKLIPPYVKFEGSRSPLPFALSLISAR